MANQNKIVYGERIFYGKDIKGGKMHIAASLLSSSLEANTFSPLVKSRDRTLADFERNAPLTYFHKGRQIGVFYVQDIERVGPDLYRFSATSAIGLLSEAQHYGGIYTGQSAQEIITDICGSVPVIVKTDIQGVKLYGWLPIATRRDNLAQVLFAIGASVKTDLDGALRIENLWDGISSEMGRDHMYQGPKVRHTSKVTQIIVTEHQYVEGGDEIQLFEGTTQQGDVITFNEPVYGLTATGLSVLEGGANYVKVSSGSGTLKGRAYIHNTREITREVSTGKEPNIKAVKEATLVSLVNSAAVADRLVNYFRQTETIQADAVYHGETTGDRLATYHPYDSTMVKACLQSADITLSNTLKAQEELLVGFTPMKPSAGYYDAAELLTAGGAWTVPPGVTLVRAVLIGGGDGGWSGLAGEAAKAPSIISETADSSYTNKRHTKGYPSVLGGGGGKAGQGGAGGKVLTITLKVTPGAVISYTVGAGGAGGAYAAESAQGRPGGATTFAGYSSANGSVLPGGFLEETSGVLMAGTGAAGVNGGGGSGREFKSGEGWGDIVNGTPVTAFGQTFHPGSSDEGSIAADGGSNAFTGHGTIHATANGGYGGGAAYGANGANGYAASADGYVSATSTSGSAQGARGGNGADASPPPAQTGIGMGGWGGNGGGGAGSGGASRLQNYVASGLTPAALTPILPTAASPGAGSNGGEGGPGAVVLYYSRPKASAYGWMRDKNGRPLLDVLSRRTIA